MRLLIDKIRNIALEIRTGKTPPTSNPEYFGEEINWYTPSDLNKVKFLGKSRRGITEKAIADKKAIVYKPNTVLIGAIGDIGKLGVTSNLSSSNQQITGIYPDPKKLEAQYLYYWLKAHKQLLLDKSKSALVPILNNKDLGEIKISFPDNIPDQLHIANLLSKAETLITQRKETLRLLDEYLKSTFLEMFGDPVRNEKKWNINQLGFAISGIDSGWSPVCLNKPRNDESEWAILKLGSVTHRNFNPKENKLLDQCVELKKKLVPKKGDLLFSRKNTYELVGASAFIFEDYKRLLLPDTIFKINYQEDKVSGLYLWFLFNDRKFRKVIQSLASGSAGSMPNISKEKLSKLKISIPPIHLQTQFAQIVEKTEALKTQYQQSLQELENLYNTLSQKAFRGELSR
jgi:type I restriction enzyme S subunit